MAGRCASPEYRAHIDAKALQLHRTWVGFHRSSGASINPPEGIDWA